ncbi:MAG: sugar phosphate nucleotidyltransferase [Opitutales bacterium]
MAEFPRTAFILGAGLGLRLRPLTEKTPKPLLPIGGRPMVMRAMERLHAAGTRRFIINTHHAAEAWDSVFPGGRWRDAEVTLVHEPVLLDTGGGLANIAGLLGPDDRDLVVWNGDILSDCDVAAAATHHRANGAEATLVVREDGPLANVRVTDEGDVTDMRDRLGAADRAYQYAGVCVVTADFARGTPKAAESLVEHFLRRIAAARGSVQGFLDRSGTWHDLGTPEEYASVKASLERPARGAIDVTAAAALHGCAVTDGGAVIKGGSGRRFHRVRTPDGASAVLCVYDDSRPENLGYGAVCGALRTAGLNAPAVIAEDRAAGTLLLEDLGGTDLWSLAQAPAFPWAAFADTVEQAARLHREGAAATAGLTLMEPFGEGLYRWERQYFLENVVGKRRFDPGALREAESLAGELSSQPLVTLHRDLQSQNVMMREGRAWFVDLQGLRMGCAAYDFASLAFDPYLTRPDMQLWRVDIEDHAREASGWQGSRDAYTGLLHAAAAQRLMQACGAYGFLGRVKGRAEYLAHLPQGLRNLSFAAAVAGRRRLAALAAELAEEAVRPR